MTPSILETWSRIPAELREILAPIETMEQHSRAVANHMDLAFKDRDPVENQLYKILTENIKKYEDDVVDLGKDVTPVDILKSIIEEHELKQKDLVPYFGSQSVVSEVLNKKRKINSKQAFKLSEKFHINPIAFLG
ncbi:helix-turn-helix domain-containing protein [Deinococcus sp. A31D244]|uniref:helix-turn-helix domain-containing protein n=1 Tax=Deinococcus sp. A31D244 TaxID=3397675 RepID=UPI0039E1686F